MKKLLTVLTIICLAIGIFASCTGTAQGIAVVSREEGSGTRGAFEDIIGFKASDGDNLPAGATTISSGGAVLTNVAGNKNAMGYVSLGSLNNTVKAVKINGVDATSANVINETYPLYRPFVVVSGKAISELSAFEKDFYDFMVSTQAQVIISGSYVSIIEGTNYTAKYTAGVNRGSDSVISISGSTSVQPLMNSLVGKYLELNAGLTSSDIEVSGGGSGTGITNAINGTSVFGMSSRGIKSTESSELELELTLCRDGIAVIVHNDNELTNLTVAELKKVYTGEITLYTELSDLEN